MILPKVDQKELVQELKNYLKQNPKTDLLEIFNKNPNLKICHQKSVLCDDSEAFSN